jgi:hypothetical protein
MIQKDSFSIDFEYSLDNALMEVFPLSRITANLFHMKKRMFDVGREKSLMNKELWEKFTNLSMELGKLCWIEKNRDEFEKIRVKWMLKVPRFKVILEYFDKNWLGRFDNMLIEKYNI